MVSKVALVLVGLVAVVLLLISFVFVDYESSAQTVDAPVITNRIAAGGVVADYENQNNYVYGCSLSGLDQKRGIGNCKYPVVSDKKCYKEVVDGCVIKQVEVSCFDSVKQVKGKGKHESITQIRGDGNCFDEYGQIRNSCKIVKKVGCFDKYGETSCLEVVPQVRHSCDSKKSKSC